MSIRFLNYIWTPHSIIPFIRHKLKYRQNAKIHIQGVVFYVKKKIQADDLTGGQNESFDDFTNPLLTPCIY